MCVCVCVCVLTQGNLLFFYLVLIKILQLVKPVMVSLEDEATEVQRTRTIQGHQAKSLQDLMET